MTDLSEETTSLRRVVDDLKKAVPDLRGYGRRSRNIIYLLVISLVFDLVLTVFVYHVAAGAERATTAAHQVEVENLASCEATNQGRALQVRLWTTTFSELASSSETAKQRAGAAEFLALVDKTYAPRKC